MYITVINLVYVVTVGSVLTALLAVLYRVIRPKFSIKVNCWFCNYNTKVPYGNQNCWDCPQCEQYNGFTQDGDYNKPVPAQFCDDLNHPVSVENRSKDSFGTSSNVLCDTCTMNQLLKVKQLSNFTPFSEATFEVETEHYRQHLEQVYRLCSRCESRVYEVLDLQDRKIRKQLSRDGFSVGSRQEAAAGSGVRVRAADTSFGDQEDSACNSHLLCQIASPDHARLLRLTSLLAAVALLLVVLHKLLTHADVSKNKDAILPKSLTRYMQQLHDWRILVVVLGISTTAVGVFTSGLARLRPCDVTSCVAWLATLLLQSKRATDALAESDVYILEVLSAAFTVVMMTWCSLGHKGGKKSKTRIKPGNPAGRSLVTSTTGSGDGSRAPSLINEVADDNSSSVSDGSGRQIDEEDEYLSDLETMNLGPRDRRKKMSKRKSVFSVFSGGSNEPGTSHFLKPGMSSGLRSGLSVRNGGRGKQIISPARFRHNPASAASRQRPEPSAVPPKLPLSSENVSIFGGNSSQSGKLFHSTPFPGRGQALQSQPSFRTAPGLDMSAPDDDRASLFSELRGVDGDSDSDSAPSVDKSAADTTSFPVGKYNNRDVMNNSRDVMNNSSGSRCLKNREPGRRRTLLWQCIMGVSLGVTVALILWMTSDLQRLWRHVTGLFTRVAGRVS